MIDLKKILAIIPARGGSKELPRKNVLDLGGSPLISWTINAAKNSKYIDRVILSSDDEEIFTVAKEYGCEVPFVRPAELASDTADSASVVRHAIEQVGSSYDIIVLLQPTSPFRGENHIDAALEQYISKDALSLVSVASLNKSPEWLFWLNAETTTLSGVLKSENINTRRQDASTAYYLNGAIYIFDKNYFMENNAFMDKHSQAFIMDSRFSLDIDTREDFNLAKIYFDCGQYTNRES